MSLLTGIVLAVLLGVVLGVLLARLRARRRPSGAPPHDMASLLRAYRHGHYDDVVEAAPQVSANMGAVTGTTWRARLELAWGHSLFELDRFAEAIPHLRLGLEESEGPHEAESRFRHCLGYALQRTGDSAGARAIYAQLLDDADLDPQVRKGVEHNLSELDAP